MKFYTVPPTVAAIFICAVVIIAIALLVVLPIALIQWFWNSLVVTFISVPIINPWQAALLYLAFATFLYVVGFVRIEIHADEH